MEIRLKNTPALEKYALGATYFSLGQAKDGNK